MLQKWYRFVQVLLALLSCLFLCSTNLKAVSNNETQATMEEEIPVGDVTFVARMGDEYGIKNGNIKILNVSDIETRSSECFEKELEVLFELPSEDIPPKKEELSLIDKVVTSLKEKMLASKTAYADE